VILSGVHTLVAVVVWSSGGLFQRALVQNVAHGVLHQPQFLVVLLDVKPLFDFVQVEVGVGQRLFLQIVGFGGAARSFGFNFVVEVKPHYQRFNRLFAFFRFVWRLPVYFTIGGRVRIRLAGAVSVFRGYILPFFLVS